MRASGWGRDEVHRRIARCGGLGNGLRIAAATSKRPGHIARPYAGTEAFIADYAAYRGRRIVSFKEVESYERKLRTAASRQNRAQGQ